MTIPDYVSGISGTTHYLSLPHQACTEIEALGLFFHADEWRGIRKVFLAALADGRLEPLSLHVFTPPKQQRLFGARLLATLAWVVPIRRLGCELTCACQVLTGSPTGRQPYTLRVLHVAAGANPP